MNWNLATAIGQWGGIIASLVVAFIALFNSRKAEEQNRRIDLYNKRYDLYKRCEKIIRGFISQDEKLKDIAMQDMVDIQDEISFLFDKDIERYYSIVFDKCSKMNRYYYEEPNSQNIEYLSLREWLLIQIADKKEQKQIFSRYLDLSNYGISKKK
jgi:hypothetical protein